MNLNLKLILNTTLHTFIGAYVHSHLKAIIEEEKCDMFPAVTRLVPQGDGFYPVHQTAMGGQQVGLQRRQNIDGQRKTWRIVSETKRQRKTELFILSDILIRIRLFKKQITVCAVERCSTVIYI